ncbi:MAG: polysaccharide deacetylase family protein [Lachnospiraceae bacterium]|nr:polysaccharide deacetylase family protein [Lachnospiraceae bacterium]
MIKKMSLRIITLIVLIFSISINYASNIIISGSNSKNESVSVHNDSSYESELLASASEVDSEAAIQAYISEIANAFMSVELPPKYNLPTLYMQPTIHPVKEGDWFGKFSDDMPIFKVDVENDSEKNNLMCLTFDSAYINKYTIDILDILDKYDIKSTFFMTYEFMVKNPDQIMEIIKRGHEIGNHSTSHPDFNKISDSRIVKEVMKAHNFIKDLVGVEMCLFRFPFGSYSPRTVGILKNMGYYSIQWTLDSIDWKNSGKEFLINRFTGNDDLLAGGSIILFHNGATYTPEALPEIIDMIYSKGLKCVKVSDLIYHHDFHVLKGQQIKGQYSVYNYNEK